MFFYQFDTLENFIDNDFAFNVDLEIKKISKIIDLYTNKKSILLNITQNLMTITNNLEKDKLDEFYKINTLAKTCFEELDFILLSANNSRDVLFEILNLFQKNTKDNLDKIKANLVEYNKKDEELLNKTIDFDKKLISIMDYSVTLPTSTHNFQQNDISISSEKIISDNNVLTISEKDQKA